MSGGVWILTSGEGNKRYLTDYIFTATFTSLITNYVHRKHPANTNLDYPHCRVKKTHFSEKNRPTLDNQAMELIQDNC